jgi:hypothetical protein
MAFRYLGIPSETHLPDRLALRMLVQAFRPELMDRLVDGAERRERRRRLLPAQLMMYFALAMWLFGASSYEEVLAKLTGGLPEMFQDVGDLATAAAIARARMRLGVEPLKALCGHLVAAAAQRAAAGGERVFVLESIAMEAPDTPANRGAYGAPEPKGPEAKGRAVEVWLTSLTDCHLRVSVVAAITPSREQGVGDVLAQWPHDLLDAGALVVGDDETVPVAAWWNALTAAGVHQIWRVSGRGRGRGPGPLPVVRELPDGSYLANLPDLAGAETPVDPPKPANPSKMAAGGRDGGRDCGRDCGRDGGRDCDRDGTPELDPGAAPDPLVRVVPCRATAASSTSTASTASAARRPADPDAEAPPLVTSFLDDAVTARDITARHARVVEMRRNGVGPFTRQIAGPRVVLRSKSPELVQQEIYAMLCTYHAVGHLVSPMNSDGPSSAEDRLPGGVTGR